MLSFEYQNDKEKFNNAITRQGEREGFVIKSIILLDLKELLKRRMERLL